jgi:hypothetical protein
MRMTFVLMEDLKEQPSRRNMVLNYSVGLLHSLVKLARFTFHSGRYIMQYAMKIIRKEQPAISEPQALVPEVARESRH